MNAKQLEKAADELLREDARKRGYIKGKSLRGYGDYARAHGIMTSKQKSTVEKTEKTGFNENQIESIMHNGVDADTRRKYAAEDS